MIIKKIKIRDFRNFENIEMEFPKGIVVLKGPNEAGKSSLLNALKLSLFGDATTSRAEILMQKRWNADNLFLIEVHLQEGDETFIISKDWESKKNVLSLPDGTTLKDKKRIQEKIIKLIKLPSEKSFLSTICVTQDEIKKIEAGLPEIKKLLEEKISGGEVDLNDLLKSLDKENKEIRKAGPKYPGLIKRAEDIKNELESQLTDSKIKVNKLEKDRVELSQVLEGLPKLVEEIQLKTEAVENAKKYLDAKKHFDEASKKYDEIEKMIARRKASKERVKKTTKDLKVVDEELKDKEKRFQGGKKFLKLVTERDSCTKELKELSEDINKLSVLRKELSNIQNKISKKKAIDEKDYRNVLALPGEISSLEAGLAAQEIIVSLFPNKEFKVSFKVDDLNKRTRELKEKEELEIIGKAYIQLIINDLVNIDVLNREKRTQALSEEIRRKKSVLRSMFKRYGVASIKELKNAWNELQKLKKSESRKTIEYETILNGRELEEIKNEKEERFKKLELLNRGLDKMKGYSITAKEMKTLEKEVEKIRKKREKLKEFIDKNLGALEELKEEDELEEERKTVAKELAIHKAELEKLEMFKCTGEDFMKKESALRKLKENLSKLGAKKEFLEMVIKENENMGVEDIATLEEKLSFKKDEICKLKRKTEINDIISEALSKARVQTIKDISDELSQKIEEILSYITDGRYNKIKLGENLDVKLWSDKKSNWMDDQSPYQEISSGTLDQLYLATRFALTEVIVPDTNLPIFMDDPFTHFDPERRTKALELCKKLSKKHQILIFTCFDYSDEFAEKILKVSEIT